MKILTRKDIFGNENKLPKNAQILTAKGAWDDKVDKTGNFVEINIQGHAHRYYLEDCPYTGIRICRVEK